MVGSQLPLPHADFLPAGANRMSEPDPATAGRRLRQGTCLVVHAGGIAPAALASKTVADGQSAPRLPRRRRGGLGGQRQSAVKRPIGCRHRGIIVALRLSPSGSDAMRVIRIAVLAVGFALAVSLAWAQSGQLDIENAWARATPGGATTGAAYVSIRSPTADRLVGAATPVAGKAELHKMEMS